MQTWLIPDMHCQHCVATIRRTILELDADATLNVDLPTHTLTLETRLAAETVANALAESGFDSQPA